MALPKKILSRKDGITTAFFTLMEKHITELLQGKAARRYHARDFGSLLFIHPVHLTNTIKLTTGKSPCEFMEERLTAEAKKLLLETDMPIADIGYLFKYENATNFTAFFKGMEGVTPLQFRKAYKAKNT